MKKAPPNLLKAKLSPISAQNSPPVPLMRPRCPQISRLPKSPLKHGVTYRNQTPGSPLKLIAGGAAGSYVDAKHPAVKSLLGGKHSGGARSGGHRNTAFTAASWKFVRYHSPTQAFSIVAAPKSFLLIQDRKSFPYFDTGYEKWEDRVARVLPEREVYKTPWERKLVNREVEGDAELGKDIETVRRLVARKRNVISKGVPLSLAFATNKAKMGGHPVYGTKVRRRVRSAINLIVMHGARGVIARNTNDLPLTMELVHDLEEVKQGQSLPGSGWIIKDWTYLVFPTLNLYRMPIPNLVEELRGALKYIYERGMASEKQWMDDAVSAKGSGPVGTHAMKEGPRRGPVSRDYKSRKDRKNPVNFTDE